MWPSLVPGLVQVKWGEGMEQGAGCRLGCPAKEPAQRRAGNKDEGELCKPASQNAQKCFLQSPEDRGGASAGLRKTQRACGQPGTLLRAPGTPSQVWVPH